MRVPAVVLTGVALALGCAQVGEAQTFLLNSAETINPGNFKVAGYPIVFLAEGDADNMWGTGGRIGIGLVNRFDIEGSVAVFDGFNLYGADAEVWLLNGPVDLSVVAGGHIADRGERLGSKALDLATIVSAEVTSGIEFIVGGSWSKEWFDELDQDFTRTYIVPGAEIRLAQDLDLIAEFGLALDDDNVNYAAFGLAYYIR